MDGVKLGKEMDSPHPWVCQHQQLIIRYVYLYVKYGKSMGTLS